MAKNFDELIAKMPPEARQKAKEKTDFYIKEMLLREIREARKLSQEEMAVLLNVNQAAISKMERRTDMYLSTLRKVILAMGGELELIAKFPEGAIKIQQLSDLEQT